MTWGKHALRSRRHRHQLLLGIIVDSNSAWIGEQLALAGIDSHFQAKVGDNFARIEATIRQALERSDAVICCGGLGPTQDDITRDVIARAMGVEMQRDERIADQIRKFFEARGPGSWLRTTCARRIFR
jgi:nicotinamide-nucleotide amidase